jgi:hypothetical protein
MSFDANMKDNINRGKSAFINVSYNGLSLHERIRTNIRCDREQRKSMGPILASDGVERVLTQNIIFNSSENNSGI